MFIITIIVAIIIGLFVFLKYQIIGKELKVSFVTAQKHTPKDLTFKGGINDFEWIIISGEEQRKNLEQEGYVIPYVDFSKNYLIMSRYKISKLYRKAGNNTCLGVPDGRAVFDKENSDENFYYFYIMSKIMLSQGVG